MKHASMKHATAAHLAALAAAVMLPLAAVPTADAARYTAPAANSDRVTTQPGTAAIVRTKANDAAFRKRRATVHITDATAATAIRLRASVRRDGTIRVVPPRRLAPGRYTFGYRLTDVRGRRDTARVTVHLTAPVLTAPTVAPTDPASDSTLPLLDVAAASDLSSRVGIRDFPHYDTATYGKRAAVEKALGDLGVTWVSVKYVPAKDEIADLDRLHAMGVKTVLTVGETKGGYEPETDAFWKQLSEQLVRWGDSVPMVVGWNEPNHVRGGGSPLPSDWALRTLRDNMTPLRKAVDAANARMTHQVQVGLPALWSGDTTQFRRDASTLAGVRHTDAGGTVWSAHDSVDALTYHLYPRGGDPTWELDQTIAALRDTFSEADPTPWCTEAGYFTAANYNGGAKPVTEAQQAAYVARMGLEHYLRDGYVSYFETVDDVDPADADREASLGLIDTPTLDPATWRRKPAFGALAGILNRTGGTPTTVRAKIDAPAGVQRLATIDGAGVVVLYLWRRVDVDAHGYAAPVTVTVTTPAGTRSVAVGGRVAAVRLNS